MNPDYIAAWDIGGSHLKLAVLDKASRNIITARQWPMPLWQGLPVLTRVFSAAMTAELDGLANATVRPRVRHVASMTAELTDIFPDRKSGVSILLRQLQQLRRGNSMEIYCGNNSLVKIEELGADSAKAMLAASANWQATLNYVASCQDSGILVDVGGTTTDILPFTAHRPAVTGNTDQERLRSGELVYTGVVRTPVAMVCNAVPYQGKMLRLCSERFADMADVYRLHGKLLPQQDLHDTADGRGKDQAMTAARLARMTGADNIDQHELLLLAKYLAEAQLRIIDDALAQVMSANAENINCLVAAGCGSFMVHELARRHAMNCIDINSFFNCNDTTLQTVMNDCASAVALAYLAATGVTNGQA